MFDQLSNVLIYLGFSALGLLLGIGDLWLRWGRPLKRARAQIAELKAELTVLDLEKRERIGELVVEHKEELDQLGQVRLEAQIAERRASEYLGMITGIQGERDGWRDLYFSAASGGAGAQSMLFAEVERVTRLYFEATGKMPPKNQVIDEVRQAFSNEHGGAIQEFRRDGGAARQAEQHQLEAARLEAIAAAGAAGTS